MNIRFNTVNAYVNTSTVNGKKSKNNTISETSDVKSDKIIISAKGSDYVELNKIQSDVCSGITEFGKSEKLSTLKRQIAEGNYNISSKEIADKILERFA